jgi:Uma2 family endonuclease
MALPQKQRYTADYIWESPDDGNRYEVIDGELVVSPAPDWDHQIASMNLAYILLGFIKWHSLGSLVAAPVGVVLDAGSGVQPDLVYVSRERQGIIGQRGVEGAPDLVVEFLSPGTQRVDRGRKKERYAAAGVPHYWLVDPRTRTLEPYRLIGSEYEPLGLFGPGTAYRPELFPGLEIPIDELWV